MIIKKNKSLFSTLLGVIQRLTILLLISISPLILANPPIKIGMSAALSGPTQTLGLEMRKGIEIYFAKINAQGGIHGRKLELITLDDKYEPPLAAKNVRELVKNPEILALIGNLGTPTAVVTIPIINEYKIVLFAPFTGASILRKTPPDRYIFNFRASYQEEINEMIKGISAIGIKPQEIAFIIQNDTYGDAGYQEAIKTLQANGYHQAENLAVGRYTRNTLNVEEGLAWLLDAKPTPKAIIIMGTYAPVAKFIKLASKEFPAAFFLNASFVGSQALSRELADTADGKVIVTQVVPSLNAELPAIAEYHKDLKKWDPAANPDFGSLEGYLAAKLFVIGLQKAAQQDKLTRAELVEVFEDLQDIDIGIGVKINLDKSNHQALHQAWPTILKKGQFVPLDWQVLNNQEHQR